MDARSMRRSQAYEAHVCPICSAVKSSYHALKTHCSSKHGLKRPARAYINTSHCPCCLTLFASREHVVDHLERRAPVCWAYVQRAFTRMPEEEWRALDASDSKVFTQLKKSGVRRGHNQGKVACRLEGPRPTDFINCKGTQAKTAPLRVVNLWVPP